MEVTATPVLGTGPADVERLAEYYQIRGRDEVAGFVGDHPEVLAPLLEAREVVPRYFGEGTPLVLEVERDREADDHRLLFALIRTDFDVASSLDRLRRFEDEWWLAALPRAGGKLIFGLD